MPGQQDQFSGMSNADFFIHLIYKMENLEDATVANLLIAKKAHVSPWQTSAREISSLLGSSVSKLNVQRCLDRLRRMDVIKTRVHPNRYTEISLSKSALIDVMKRPLPVSLRGFIPGVSKEVIPFMSDPDLLQAISSTAVTDGPTVPITSNNEPNSAAMAAMH